MAAVDLVAQTVMDAAVSLLNDTAKTNYGYAVQVPYINIALAELQEIFELNNISCTDIVSAIIAMSIGDTTISYNAVGQPALPSDMIEPQQVWESQHSQNIWTPMTRRLFLPHYLEGINTNMFLVYVWQNNTIQVLPATQANDIKIDYTRNLFSPVVDQSSIINVINGQTFLEFRTAGLMAEFIERNITSSQSLNNQALLALDRSVGIGVKGKQKITVRRRPFRSAYKRRGYIG
jgi:hypothetical protein